MTRVLVVGGGFGGLRVVQGLRRAPVEVTLVDRRNFHLFQPLLYQVATGGLSPGNIAVPLRRILSRQKNAAVVLGEVTGLDPARREVTVGGRALAYDVLVLATGVRNDYHGHDAWAAHAPGLKTVEDATEMRRRFLLALEAAEQERDPRAVRRHLTFVVVGGGPTGVELAGTLGEMTRYTLRHEYRRIDPGQARILLVQAMDRILPAYAESLSRRAERALRRLGVDVRAGTLVEDIGPDGVTLARGGERERVETHTVFWAAGVRAPPLVKDLGAPLDRLGRVRVAPDLNVPGRPEIFVIGDLALCEDRDGRPLPGIAPVAIQQGRYVARRIAGRAAGPFRYRHLGAMATIGRAAAVAQLGRVRLWGFPAWVIWLFVHLVWLVLFSNKVLVLFQWAWNYLTYGRSALIITGEEGGRTEP